MISVKYTNPEMAGKSLREADREHHIKRLEAEADSAEHEGQRREASQAWRGLVELVSKQSDVGMVGYTEAEASRARLGLSFGKGLHEEPYIGRDEYDDPLMSGFETDDHREDFEGEDQTEVAPDTPNSMDRFRSRAKRSSDRGGQDW